MRHDGDNRLGEAAFRWMVERSAELTWLLSADGVVVYANRRAESAFGSPAGLPGRTFFDLLAEGDRRRIRGVLLGLEDPGALAAFEAGLRREDGSLCRIDARATVLPEGSSEPGILVTAREASEARVDDAGERRKREQQWGRAQRMEALGRLACGVAHDFNNLLTAILGYTDILQASAGSGSESRLQIAEIRKAGLKAASLTRQLLTFGRGKVVDATRVELNEVVEEMYHLLARLTGDGVDLVLDLAPDLEPLLIDRSQIEQVILNLVVNARDAMEGAGRLTIRTHNQRVERPFVLHHDTVQPGRYTMLAVRDTGCGIDEKIMDHLFEPFFTTKRHGDGTGLGLSTVYGIVKQNRGFISVYNEPEGGVTFKVSFPSLPETGEAAAPAPVRPATADRRAARTVLLAEDDDAVRRLLEEALWDHGYMPLVACDGQQALELAESHPGDIDLLLTDISMPRLDGPALADRLSALRPGMAVLFISGTARREALDLDGDGRHEFLEKPFTPNELMEVVATLI